MIFIMKQIDYFLTKMEVGVFLVIVVSCVFNCCKWLDFFITNNKKKIICELR